MPRKIPKDGLIRIYSLIDPRNLEIRYIGKTRKEVESRLIEHISKARKSPTTHRDKWINSLIRLGLKPEIKVIEYCTKDIWQDREIYWISYYRGIHSLTNHSDGGGGSNLNKGVDNHNAKFSTQQIREAVTLYVLGCSYNQIKTLTPFQSLRYKTLRSWAEKGNRVDETTGIPMKSDYIRESKNELY